MGANINFGHCLSGPQCVRDRGVVIVAVVFARLTFWFGPFTGLILCIPLLRNTVLNLLNFADQRAKLICGPEKNVS